MNPFRCFASFGIAVREMNKWSLTCQVSKAKTGRICFLQIANVLLHNKEKSDSGRACWLSTYGFGQRLSSTHRPILVVCYTNHALDQFLEGIHQFHPEGIVRVGGRSQSATMKECSLSELRHKMYKVRLTSTFWRRLLQRSYQTRAH